MVLISHFGFMKELGAEEMELIMLNIIGLG